MPRAKTFMCWRASEPEPEDRTGQAMLQTLNRCNVLAPHHHGDPWKPCHGGLRWMTVARGPLEDLNAIAQALNKSKYQMFDTRPPDAREKACARGTKARSGRKS